MKKIILVFGTRPEAVKMAPLFHALKQFKHEFTTLVCVTAQHREMLDQVLTVFDIQPDIDMNLMKKGQDLFDITSSVLLGMRDVFLKQRPDLILVHGDTTTSSAASIAGFYAGVPVGHVEAGLRTHNIRSPFPEEFNRRLTSIVADLHFAPTEIARNNLLAEGVNDLNVFVTGNTVIDAMHWVLRRIDADSERRRSVIGLLNEKLGFNWLERRYVLITGHRRENFGEGFLGIAAALNDLATRYPQFSFVYPVHLNPNVQAPILSVLSDVPNVHLVAPLEYEPFLYLLKHCHIVLTDSGGIQEEAPSLCKPVVVMRNTTERPEGVLAGTVRLVGAERDKIVSVMCELLDNDDEYMKMSLAHNPYGDGNACAAIVDAIRKRL
jgi:UDP-N-acetylglucosamine 2-epimerase (non-hydrolysing)